MSNTIKFGLQPIKGENKNGVSNNSNNTSTLKNESVDMDFIFSSPIHVKLCVVNDISQNNFTNTIYSFSAPKHFSCEYVPEFSSYLPNVITLHSDSSVKTSCLGKSKICFIITL